MTKVEQTGRELPLIQRGIVDSCFEEGHYEYGIAVLDRLRVHLYRPLPLHICQLLIIALYPPPPEPVKRPNRVDQPPPSPQKVQLQRQKDDLWPKPTSRSPSIALLHAFLRENSPESLMRGIPYYLYVDNYGSKDVDPFRGDKMAEADLEDNSPLRHEVLLLQRQKDCWELLRGGFVKRKQMDRYRDEAATNLPSDKIVGPYARPVLEWLIRVFEKDERQAKERGQAPHSSLLLCQIPPPRSKKGPRWDAEKPLKIALGCLLSADHAPVQTQDASSDKEFNLGMRLISLLANLTLTKPPLVSPSDLLRSLLQRLPELPVSAFEGFFAALPLRYVPLKLALLQSYVSQESEPTFDKTQSIKISTVPGPRAKPKFAGKGASSPEVSRTATSTGLHDSGRDSYPLPTPDSFFELLARPLPSAFTPDANDSASPPPPPLSPAVKIAFAKYHMVSILWTLCISQNLQDPDSCWTRAVHEGRLRNSVLTGFMLRSGMKVNMSSDVNNYLSQTVGLVSLWEAYRH